MNHRPFESCATMLRVMAHPARLAIMYAVREKQQSVTEICDMLATTQPSISQHLSALRREGLVSYTEEGAKRYYFLVASETLSPLLDALEMRRRPDVLNNSSSQQ